MCVSCKLWVLTIVLFLCYMDQVCLALNIFAFWSQAFLFSLAFCPAYSSLSAHLLREKKVVICNERLRSNAI